MAIWWWAALASGIEMVIGSAVATGDAGRVRDAAWVRPDWAMTSRQQVWPVYFEAPALSWSAFVENLRPLEGSNDRFSQTFCRLAKGVIFGALSGGHVVKETGRPSVAASVGYFKRPTPILRET